MKSHTKLSVWVAVAAVTLAACGSTDSGETRPDPIDLVPAQDRSEQPLARSDDREGRIESSRTESTEAASADRAATGETPNTEPDDVEFQDHGDNPFVDAGRDPLSTFAVDVDTGSYTIMRRWLEEGLIPPPESVRTEEYVNALPTGYDSPDDDTFAVYADGGPSPFTDREDDLMLRLVIQGRDVATRARPDLNVTFVVDVSGSMREEDRIELVRDALTVATDRLDGADRLAIVAYDDRAWVAMHPTVGDDRRAIASAIDGLHPGGSTNAEAGVLLGYDLAEEMFDRDAVNTVVLLSDGVANVGEEGPEGILDQIGRSVDRGIRLVTVGVGLGNYNDVLMEQLADGADGSYHYADTLAEAERVFDDQLTGTFVPIARDVKVQVEFDPDAVEWYRLIGFENREVADEDFRDDRVDGGEIGAGHSVTALYQIELAPGVGSRDRIGDVSVRWFEPDERGPAEVTGVVDVDVLADRWVDTDPWFRVAATAAAFAEHLGDGRYATEYDLADVSDAADDAAREVDDERVDEFADLVAAALRLDDRR